MVNFGVTRVSLHLIHFVVTCSFIAVCSSMGERWLNTGADGNSSNEISFFRARQGSSESQFFLLSEERELLFGGTDCRQKEEQGT